MGHGYTQHDTMKTWRTKMLGDNRMNFYGWCVAGLLVMGVSAWCVIRAVRAGATGTPGGWLLMAIYFVLLGQFGIAIHNYTARVAEKLDAEDEQNIHKTTIP
jgi:hypothetical protein